MEEVLNKIEELRKNLLDAYVENDHDGSLEAVFKMGDVSSELKETLVLLHSMNKAELQAIRNHNFRNVNDLLNTQYVYVIEVEKKLKELEELVNVLTVAKKENNKFKFFTTNKIIMYAGVGLFIFFSIWLMATADKDATLLVHQILKDGLSFKDK